MLLAVGLLAALAYRAYAPGFQTRPTEIQSLAFDHPIDLNRAERAELLQVPHVGPHLADAILTHREQKGPFESLDQLNDVRGIGDKTLDKLRPWLTIGPAPVQPPAEPTLERLERKPIVQAPPVPVRTGKIQQGEPPIDLNTASAEELARLPGIGPVTAAKIVTVRQERRFSSVDDLKRVKGIGTKILESLKPFAKVSP